ncbi:MAG TPA: DUF3261 domain-containing protein [Candidatus Binataceae bacterium]|nr:DUF3261 domain-containing protein [Candidatus Binataceae bacterium]
MKLAALRLLLCVSMLSFAACAAHYSASPGSTAIAPGLDFSIPSGRELGHSLEATQLITAHFHDQVQVFQAYISVSPEKIIVIALDPFGSRAMTITATDDGIHSEVAPMVPSVLRPANILADIAIVYWPAPALRRALAGTNASLSDDQNERAIIVDGREVVHVSYSAPHENSWTKFARLRNIAYGYELDLQSTVTEK